VTTSAVTLAELGPGASGRVVTCAVDAEVSRWLGALGIAPGVCLTVLRRGVFGGPLHVRAENGAEFALGRDLARGVSVRAEASA